jgi:mandelamide amidase
VTGVVPISMTLDTIGVMARTVADVAVVDATLAGEARDKGEDAASARPRLGVPSGWFLEDLDADVERAFHAALGRLEASGAELVAIDLADVSAAVFEVYSIVCSFECLTALTSYLWSRGIALDDLVSAVATPPVRRSLAELVGEAGVPPRTYRRAMRVRHAVRDEFTRAVASHRLAAIVYPCTALPATPLGQDDVVALRDRDVPVLPAFIRNTVFAAVLGGPALTTPMRPADPGGLPLGLEIAGCPGGDRALLALGASLEGAARG